MLFDSSYCLLNYGYGYESKRYSKATSEYWKTRKPLFPFTPGISSYTFHLLIDASITTHECG